METSHKGIKTTLNPSSNTSSEKKLISGEVLLNNNIGASEIPAGGTNPNRFDIKEAWYPIHYIKDLERSKLTRFTLLGQDLVIWWVDTPTTV